MRYVADHGAQVPMVVRPDTAVTPVEVVMEEAMEAGAAEAMTELVATARRTAFNGCRNGV